MMELRKIQSELIATADPESPFDPPYPTLSIGELNGGSAANILARECKFVFDLRCPPGYDPDAVLEPFLQAAEAKDLELKSHNDKFKMKWNALKKDIKAKEKECSELKDTLRKH